MGAAPDSWPAAIRPAIPGHPGTPASSRKVQTTFGDGLVSLVAVELDLHEFSVTPKNSISTNRGKPSPVTLGNAVMAGLGH